MKAPLISVVTVGEMLSLAGKFGWGEDKVQRTLELMRQCTQVDINSASVLRRYAAIDVWCGQNGYKPGKNDLWIAACAAETSSQLLTTDGDFDPLPQFVDVVKLDPNGTY